ALDLVAQGHEVTGSDDEIYEPSLSRLINAGIAPVNFGWFEEKITSDIDIVILGMHAKVDNPELLKAQSMGLNILSYPAFVYWQSKNKKRVVIAGSHGKTTTTAMILHVLKKLKMDFDYLVGAQLEGFERMVRLSDAPLIIIEGDEYLSSAVDRVPKIHHYKPHVSVITGIAWDHINVFPTFDSYKKQFVLYLDTFEENGTLFFYKNDEILCDIVENNKAGISKIPYAGLIKADAGSVMYEGNTFPISIIGNHNLENLNAARLVCESLGINTISFFGAIADFTGANKRLQKLSDKNGRLVFLDFAHAPSKVKATTTAVKEWYGDKKLLGVLELHTFSSLNKDFIPQYHHALAGADKAIVYYNEHTLKMKNMPDLDLQFLRESFDHPDISLITETDSLYRLLHEKKYNDYNILLMTSGNFNNMPLEF
ncbi:MAG: peptidoglycan synthetase, partial [Saprospiraceae bacterium]|nr:peptidoglycan synthetase [Saprospiraceae bacterium]